MTEEQVIEAIVADDRTRRELLWLRAKEKGDEAGARDLERVDSQIVQRLQRAGLDVEDYGGESSRARAARYGASWNKCYLRHVASLRRG